MTPLTNSRGILDRRGFLRAGGTCCGGVGLAALFQGAARAGEAALHGPRVLHHEPKAQQLLVVFLTGGMSHVDTFDYKPRLAAESGRDVPSFGLREDETKNRPLLGSPFSFKQYGESGLWVSELFPHLGEVADELCVIRTLHTDIVEHFQAVLAMHTGSATIPLPSLGSWLSYGLGTLNANMPASVVLCEHLPYAGTQVWASQFLAPEHGGVRIIPGDHHLADLKSERAVPSTLAEMEARFLADVDREHAKRRPGDMNLTGRIASFGVARGMMREAPEAFDLSRESGATRRLYGIESDDGRSFGAQCLTARRLIERGVRVVELIDTGSSNNWDAHGDMADHRPKARRVDQALAAMIRDLRGRGLLETTLVAICTEFGRTPWTDGPGTKGRNHYAKAFTCLLSGAGVKGGTAYGETDEFGINIIDHKAHVHDYHATILHLLGIDHTRLVYRYAGRDFRLTDVAGNVLEPILA